VTFEKEKLVETGFN